MEVYVVVSSDYESSQILGVFDNEEKAERMSEINHAKYGYTKYEINKLTNEGIYEMKEYIKDLKEDLGLEE